MHASISILLNLALLAAAKPLLEVRTVTALNTAAFEEAQQRDNTATRAFSSTEILTSDGQCLFIDELSGDFRANLNPIGVASCDGTQGQLWDIITKGEHDDQAGTMLVVSTLTQACMNFDPRRAAGNTVIMFSCGGRADGGGAITPSQLFNYTSGGAGPLPLAPINVAGTCLAVKGAVLDSATCSGDSTQMFTFGKGSGAAASVVASTAIVSSAASSATASPVSQVASATAAPCTSTVLVTMTRSVSGGAATDVACPAKFANVTSSASAAGSVVTANPTSAVPVSGAGGVLNPSAAAESNPLDTSAKSAFSNVPISTSDNQCLTVNPLAGDFRQNLIPISLQPCLNNPADLSQKFNFVTSGAHNNAPDSTLVVSSLTNGCLNFDPRRKAGNQVLLFSCGGRADGGGDVTNSQLFSFNGTDKSLALEPENGPTGTVCLFGDANTKLLDAQGCDGSTGQVFTVG